MRDDIADAAIEFPDLAGVPGSEGPEAPGSDERREDPDWVDTPSSRLVFSTLAAARRHAEIAVIHGGTGTGKTAAAKRYASTSEHVWVAGMSPAADRLRPCLQQLAQAFDLGYVSGGAHRIQIELVRSMRGTGGLLVIDEAQHLGHSQLEQLRHLYDATECGLALLGNDLLGSRIGHPQFAALASRVGARLPLPRVTAEDVDALLDAWGIGGASAREDALALSAPPGGVRAVTRALKRGTLASGKGAKPRSARRGGAA